mgnify:CR=1 FL=1
MGDESTWYSLVECMFHRTLVHVLSVHHAELSWGDVACSVWFCYRAETPTTTHIDTAQLNKCIDNTCTRVPWHKHSTNGPSMDGIALQYSTGVVPSDLTFENSVYIIKEIACE